MPTRHCPSHPTFTFLVQISCQGCFFVQVRVQQPPTPLLAHDAVSCTLWASRCSFQHATYPSSPPLIKSVRRSDTRRKKAEHRTHTALRPALRGTGAVPNCRTARPRPYTRRPIPHVPSQGANYASRCGVATNGGVGGAEALRSARIGHAGRAGI